MVSDRPTDGLLRVRRGRAPNCSATGSVVGLAIGGAIAAAALLNAFADRFAGWRDRDEDGDDDPGGPDGSEGSGDGTDAPSDPPAPDEAPPRLRREAFGGILAWNDPPALLYVDGPTADAAHAAGAQVLPSRPAPPGALRAPTEVHLAVTERCPVACDDCYLDAGPTRTDDPAAHDLVDDLRRLAAMGVFEVALGGGEAGLRSDLVDLCRTARAEGLVPNLTTSGFGLSPALAHQLRGLVGQVNVSMDGIDGDYRAVRGWDGRRIARRALRVLRDADIRVGVNTVLTRANLPGLEAMASALVRLGVSEWQWVRFKPAGRGRDTWDRLAPHPDDLLDLWPRLVAIEQATGLVMRVDCALVPFVAASAPSADLAARLGVTGCNGGESLWTRTADGRWAPCSFAHELVDDRATGRPEDRWHDEPVARAWRDRAAAPPAPCATCDWQTVCRGGCRIVAHHLTGDPLAPDPQCPRVRAHVRSRLDPDHPIRPASPPA